MSMTEATITLVDGLQFLAQTDSGHALVLDGRSDAGGKDSAPRPMELMAVSLAACTAMDVISILRKMQQTVTGFQVRVAGERAEEHPKKFLKIHLEYTVIGRSVAEDRVARAIELSETKYCSAMATLRPGVEITSSYQIVEATDEVMRK